ncbi:Nif3-like dinuclear metal center hexameric protein [bacterium]|nr:Nif3-like dinuclear metal center hexameric protein [bacterium]MBU1872502.1 Nif3-like dinuclear metal center hexameric protein [bacterium]
MNRNELLKYLDELLEVSRFSDYGPNGLQVEGRDEIKTIVTAVSASVELFEKAIELQADAVLVHHGVIWNFERPVYQGGYKQRIKLLLENDINLFAYHLPLDAHLKYGNAAQIARRLGLVDIQPFGDHEGNTVGVRGRASSTSYADIFEVIRRTINPDALLFPFGPKQIERVGIISGGAQKELKQAILADLDMYVTGEASEFVMHLAKEEKIHFVAAGHYATERFGIMALGDHLAKKFDVKVEFVDIPNPV